MELSIWEFNRLRVHTFKDWLRFLLSHSRQSWPSLTDRLCQFGQKDLWIPEQPSVAFA